MVLKNIYTKKINLSSPFLYCIVAYQNVSKIIISILTNHIVWITSLPYAISFTDQAGVPLANYFVRSDFLLNSHWLATFLQSKKVESNPTFYCFGTKRGPSYEKICKWKSSFKFKIRYVNKNFVDFIQISSASRV